MGNDGGMIECPELEAAFGSAVLVGRSGASGSSGSQWAFFGILWDIIGIYEEIMGFWEIRGLNGIFHEFYDDMM